MLETLESLTDTQGGENSVAESISRKDCWLAYLAGLVDGEGCISARWSTQSNPKHYGDNRLSVSVGVYNTHPFIIKRAEEVMHMLGIKFCTVIENHKSNPKYKIGSNVGVHGKGNVKKLLTALLPWLTAKQDQAKMLMELIDYRESLAIDKSATKGRFGNLHLKDDPKINFLISEISRVKTEHISILECSRVANFPITLPSTTTRFPQFSN